MKRESGSALHIYGCLFLIVLALAGCGAALDTSDTDAERSRIQRLKHNNLWQPVTAYCR